MLEVKSSLRKFKAADFLYKYWTPIFCEFKMTSNEKYSFQISLAWAFIAIPSSLFSVWTPWMNLQYTLNNLRQFWTWRCSVMCDLWRLHRHRCRNDEATLVNMLILLGLDVIVVFSGSFESFSREIVFSKKNLEMSRFYIQYDRVWLVQIIWTERHCWKKWRKSSL